MNNGDNIELKPPKLVAKDIKATIVLDFGDHSILKVYKKVLKAPMRTVLRFIIGMATRCFEEKHDKQIREGL